MNDDDREPVRARGFADFFRENRRLFFGSLAFAVAAAIANVVVRVLHVER